MPLPRRKNNEYPRTARLRPKVVDLSALELNDLKKLGTLCENYQLQKKDYLERKSKVDAVNKEVRRNNVIEYQLYRTTVDNRIDQMGSQLRAIRYRLDECKVGVVHVLLLADTVTFRGQSYRRVPGESLIAQHEEICRRIKDVKKECSLFRGKDCLPEPCRPANEKIIKLGATKNKLDLDKIDLAKLKALITVLESKNEAAEQRMHELKARAAVSEKETRQQAQKFKRDLRKQMMKVSGCPYCAGTLDETNAHLDHIYPVSKGGRSTVRNLVFVCAKCNLIKKAQTLRQFLLITRINSERVYARLELLNKDM